MRPKTANTTRNQRDLQSKRVLPSNFSWPRVLERRPSDLWKSNPRPLGIGRDRVRDVLELSEHSVLMQHVMLPPDKLSRAIDDLALDDASLSDHGLPTWSNRSPNTLDIGSGAPRPRGTARGSSTQSVGTAGRRPAVAARPFDGPDVHGDCLALSRKA